MNRMLCSITDGRQYDDDLETFDDEPDNCEKELILEAIGLGEWQDHYATVDVAYMDAYRLNGDEMEEAFRRLKREERAAAKDLLDAIENIGSTPFMLLRQAD